jgi:hypothetical protein
MIFDYRVTQLGPQSVEVTWATTDLTTKYFGCELIRYDYYWNTNTVEDTGTVTSVSMITPVARSDGYLAGRAVFTGLVSEQHTGREVNVRYGVFIAGTITTVSPVWPDDYVLEDLEPPTFRVGGASQVAAATHFRASSVRKDGVDLAWVDTNFNDRRYTLSRQTYSGGAWGDWVVLTTTDYGATRYSDTGLASNTRYRYKLYTVPLTGEGSAAVALLNMVLTATNETVVRWPGMHDIVVPSTTNPYTPDSNLRWPYGLIVHAEDRTYKFVTDNMHLSWQAQVSSQKAARFQTGDRTVHDMSLLNVQGWKELHRGGVGAKHTSDGTRYRQAHNMSTSDAGEIKLSPQSLDYSLSNLADNNSIAALIPWAGYNATSVTLAANSLALLAIYTDVTNTTLFRIAAFPFSGGVLTGGTVANIHTPGGTYMGSWAIFRNKLYIARSGFGMSVLSWNTGTSLFDSGAASVEGHVVHADGEYLYRAIGNELYRSPDPMAGTPEWQGPVRVGSAAPITGITTYGTEDARAIFVTTWHGCYRVLEESVTNDVNNKKTIKSSFPVDVRPGMADDYNGKFLSVVNNEVVWNYPGTLARHSLGATSISSPWDDNGVDPVFRGRIVAMQDGRGGIHVATDATNIAGAKPMLWRWTDGRWHHFAAGDFGQYGTNTIRGMAWTSRQYATTSRLWVFGHTTLGAQVRPFLRYYLMPTSTANYALVGNQRFVQEGEIEFPTFTGEMDGVDKLWHNVAVQFDHEVTAVHDVEVATCTDFAVSPPTFKSEGTYSPVPVRPSRPDLRRWVPVSDINRKRTRNEAYVDGVLLGNELSEGIRVKVRVKRPVQQYMRSDLGRYPTSPLLSPKVCVSNDHILVYGKSINQEGDDGNNAGMYANYDAAIWRDDHWEMLRTDAFTITDVKWSLTHGVFLLAGAFSPLPSPNPEVIVEAPTLVTYDPRTRTLTAISDIGVAATCVGTIGERIYLGYRTETTNQSQLARVPVMLHDATSLPNSVTLTTQANCVFTTLVSYNNGTMLYLKGSFTTTSGNETGVYRISLDGSNNDVLFTQSGHSFVGVTVSDLRAASVMTVANNTVYIASNLAPAKVSWFAASTAASPGTVAVTGQVIDDYAGGGPITALWPDPGNLRVFYAIAKGVASFLTAAPGTTTFQVGVAPGQAVSALAGVLTDQLFVAADPPTPNALGQLTYLYPAPTDDLTLRQSPRIQAVGLRYLEMADELRTYVLNLKLADHGENYAHDESGFSADDQLRDILRLCRSKQIFTMVMPDGTRLQGILSGPRWQQAAGEPVDVTRPEMTRVEYKCTVTVQEVVFRPRDS